MAFPNTVIGDLVSGLVGEISFDTPYTGISAVVDSTDEANNVFGRAFTYADDTVETVQAGGAGVFAGIMVNPKAHAFGVIGGTTPTADTLPNGYPSEFMHEGECYVLLINSAAAVIGDPVYFVDATGELGAGTAVAGQTQILGAEVFRHNVSPEVPTLATIRIKH
jgi:hypothetical protein